MLHNQRGFSRKRVYIGLAILCFVVFAVCTAALYSAWRAEKEAYETYHELQAQTEELPVETEPEAETTVAEEDNGLKELLPQKTVDFEEMEKINEDIYAYIFIPNTNVDYPILQHSSDDSFYLNHNLDLSKGYPGTIYTEKCNDMDFGDVVTLVYGHNMLNGTMFASLHNFEEEDFFENNRYVFVYLPEKVIVYEVFAAVTYSDEHIMKSYNFGKQSEFERFMENMYSAKDANAHFTDNITPAYEDDVLILSTCCSNPNKRFLVCAVKQGSVESGDGEK